MSPEPPSKPVSTPRRGQVVRKNIHLSHQAVKHAESIKKRIGLASFTAVVEEALRFAYAHEGPDGLPRREPEQRGRGGAARSD